MLIFIHCLVFLLESTCDLVFKPTALKFHDHTSWLGTFISVIVMGAWREISIKMIGYSGPYST
jgi:hypothetical protein